MFVSTTYVRVPFLKSNDDMDVTFAGYTVCMISNCNSTFIRISTCINHMCA